MFFQFLDYISALIFFLLHVTGAGNFPKALSAQEESRALEQMASGDKNARKRLIEHNLRLVAHIIKKYYSNRSDEDDLISIGTIGLIKAIDSFDPAKGIRLSSYASKCIENEILMFFRSAKKTAQDVSINEPIETDKDGNALTLLDTMSEDDCMVEKVDLKIKSEKLYVFLKQSLSARERKIIFMRYGIGGFQAVPQREVAEKLGISRSYVSRIEKRAIEKLKEEFEKDGRERN